MSGLAEAVYLRSPIWLQQIAIALWGVGWYRRRFSPAFHRFVREFHQRDAWSAAQFRQYQQEQLGRILEAAWGSPYYAEAFSAAGLRAGMDPWEALGRAPLLSKETFRVRGKDLLARRRLPWGTKILYTSGSTGTPARVYYTREYHALQLAVAEARSVNIGGATYRDRRFMCGGRKVCRFDQDRPPFWRYSPLENLAYASSYHLAPRLLPHYVEFLHRFRPVVVMGYPSSLAAIAEFALSDGRLPPPARMVITTAETLAARPRTAIEAAWQCGVYDRYGSCEGCCFVAQCEHGRYHVSPEVGIVEILDPQGNPCPPGTLGEVVCTGLQNWLQPLIRYRLGDAARWAAEPECPCGRQTPILDGIEGRMDDLLYTPDGRQVGRVDHIFKGDARIKEAQVVQEAVDLIVVRVVPAEGFSDHDAQTIRENMRLHVGNVEIRVQTVDRIERTAGGKFRAVVCKIPADQRRRILAAPAPP